MNIVCVKTPITTLNFIHYYKHFPSRLGYFLALRHTAQNRYGKYTYGYRPQSGYSSTLINKDVLHLSLLFIVDLELNFYNKV